ncbi:histidine kinase [Nocardioides agariphilus]|uniref:histidine kinase n=1 Tax=Nocardioides agariphilus TaxID=433664 RepID=A0A930YP68_9ACTN|nr:histidine kinase [Nocardioides agariphilus]MBF4769919.1 histidine kinase [Nocardioides agariphilus]
MDGPAPLAVHRPVTGWGVVARLVGVAFISTIALVSVPDHRHGSWLAAEISAGAVSLALVHWRRRWPLPIALVTTAISGFAALAAGPAVLAAVSLATRRVYWQVAVTGVVSICCAQLFSKAQPDNNDTWWVDLIVNVIVTAGVLGWGLYIGSRRELVWTLEQRADRAEAEQELRVSQARSTERARIAREMHDVLAHRISQISMHAGALGFRADLDAEELRANANVIRDLANNALTDLRSVLGVLRDPETGELASSPQPTFSDLPNLVEQAREAGVHVEFSDHLLSDEPVPDVVGRTLYRIVQEGITNAGKHAPGAVVRIEVSGSPDDGVAIVLRNPLGFGPSRTPGAGLGLIGLAERAELRGGRLEGRRDGQQFVLRGWIPWAA